MARKSTPRLKRPIETYEHKDKQRINNPPVGLVTPKTDPDAGVKQTYTYDPHLDPQLQWAGKIEHTSFEVPTVSLHVHERIDPRTIIQATRKCNDREQPQQSTLFDIERDEPLRNAIDFYQHAHGWSNRLVAGDSLLVMNSLLKKEGMAGKVQMVYIDPPYGIKYGSNFQPFVNKRDVKDGKDEDLTAEPEMIKAFRDTWELGIHSYLTYLRNRLLLARELLADSGSVFVQISDENVHFIRNILDEIFGRDNFCAQIAFKKTSGQATNIVAGVCDYLIWVAKEKAKVKSRLLYGLLGEDISDASYNCIEFTDGSWRRLTKDELSGKVEIPDGKRFRTANLTSQGTSEEGSQPYIFDGKTYYPSAGNHWKPGVRGLVTLENASRLIGIGNTLAYKRYIDDFPLVALNNIWVDTVQSTFSTENIFVVQTYTKVIQRCMLMTTDPGDLVLDITCGSGTTAYVAEQWGRRWITCDTSRVALTLSKQRLITAIFDYFQLAHPSEGVGSGFIYKTVPHVTLKSIVNNPEIKEGLPPAQINTAIGQYAQLETLYDQPFTDKKKTRVSGPFTVEAVPAPAVKSIEEILESFPHPADASISRSGETLRQGEWRDEMLRSGIRGKAGQHIRFTRLEPLPGCRWLHADGESRSNDEGQNQIPKTGEASAFQRIVVSFGPEHAPLEQRQVEQAIEEALNLVPRPKLIVFTAFQFDPEAAKDIDETNWPGVTLLKVQMNADLLTDDLKKKRSSNESFWLIGQPDVSIERIADGEAKDKLKVTVHGFDYYNTKTGGIESGNQAQIAVWLLDTDYDGRSLYPRQVFFPIAGEGEGWTRLARNLKAEIDGNLIEAYRGTVSLPFEPGEHRRIAVKIVDDRGIESLKVMEVE